MSKSFFKAEAIYRLLQKVKEIDENEKISAPFVKKEKEKILKRKQDKSSDPQKKTEQTKDNTSSWLFKIGLAVKQFHDVSPSHYSTIYKKFFKDDKCEEFIDDEQSPWDSLCDVYLKKEKIGTMAAWCKKLGMAPRMVSISSFKNEPSKERDKKLEGCYEGFFLRTPEIFKHKPWHVGRCWLMIDEDNIYLKSTVWATFAPRYSMITKHERAGGFVDLIFHSEAEKVKFPFQFNFTYEIINGTLMLKGTYSGYYPVEEKFTPVCSTIVMQKIKNGDPLYEEIKKSFQESPKEELEEKHDYTGLFKVHEFARKYPEFFKFLKENNNGGTSAFTGTDDDTELRVYKELAGDYSMIMLSADFMKIRRLVLRIFSTGYAIIKGFPARNVEYVYEGKVYHDGRNQVNINTYKRYRYVKDDGKGNVNGFDEEVLEGEEKCYYCYSFNTLSEDGYHGQIFSGLRIGLERDTDWSLSACRFMLYKENKPKDEVLENDVTNRKTKYDFFENKRYEEVPIFPYENGKELIIKIKSDPRFNNFDSINDNSILKLSEINLQSIYGNSDKLLIVRRKKPTGILFEENEDYRKNYFYLGIFYHLIGENDFFKQYFKRAVIHGLTKNDVMFILDTNRNFKSLLEKEFIEYLTNLPTENGKDGKWINFLPGK